MKTGGDFRDHLVDLTDPGNKSGDSNTDKQSQRKVSKMLIFMSLMK